MQLQLPEAASFLFEGEQGQYRYRAGYGGRGSAKSHSVAAALLIKARQQPLRILCVREVQKSIKDSVKRLLDDKAKDLGFDRFFESVETEIRGANGSLFLFAGMRSNPDTVKSLEGADIVWGEEANRLSERSLDILRPTVRKPKSELWFTWNPEDPKDPIDALFRGAAGAPPRSIVRRLNPEHNPWFPEELKEEMAFDQRRDPEKYQWIWRGEYRRTSEARVFKNWRVEAFETPDDARFYFGADWGFSVDPTTLVRCYIDGRTLYVDAEAYKVGCEIDKTPELFDTIECSKKYDIRADSARPETISYMRRNGYPRIVSATKGPNSVSDGIEFLKSYDIVVPPRCRPVIDEMTLYSYKQDPKTDEVLPVLLDKHNHTIDALRYAVEAARRSVPIVAPYVHSVKRTFP